MTRDELKNEMSVYKEFRCKDYTDSDWHYDGKVICCYNRLFNEFRAIDGVLEPPKDMKSWKFSFFYGGKNCYKLGNFDKETLHKVITKILFDVKTVSIKCRMDKMKKDFE